MLWEYHIVRFGECKVTVIMCVHVEDTALSVGVLSHSLNLRYIVCILTLGLCDQDMNRHFLHKHSGNKVHISGVWENNKSTSHGNKSEKYLP